MIFKSQSYLDYTLTRNALLKQKYMTGELKQFVNSITVNAPCILYISLIVGISLDNVSVVLSNT